MQAESLPQSWLMVTTVVRQPFCCFQAAHGVTADGQEVVVGVDEI